MDTYEEDGVEGVRVGVEDAAELEDGLALELEPKSGEVMGFKIDPTALVSPPRPKGSLALVSGISRGLSPLDWPLDWPVPSPPLEISRQLGTKVRHLLE